MRRVFVSLALAVMGCTRQPPLPVYGQVPDFELTVQTGEPFSRKLLDGHVWVADFIFTTCTGPCPRMSSLMRHVQASTTGIKLVSFTVDPDRDTPAVLAEYARRYHAEPGRWYFLTGDRSTLNLLARETFKLNNVDGSLDHSTRLVLMDRRGRIRGYYGTSEDSGVAQLVRDVKRLVGEKS